MEVYPYLSNDFDKCGLPMFEIQGSAVSRPRSTTGMITVSSLRNPRRLPYPTSFNDHDDCGFEVDEELIEAVNDEDGASLGDVAALAAIGVGLFAGAKVYSNVEERRRKLLTGGQ